MADKIDNVTSIEGTNNHSKAVPGQSKPGDNGDDRQKILFRKIYTRRPKSTARARMRKLRINRLLRKNGPKNALVALREVKGIQITNFVINSHANGGYSAYFTVNGKEYEGQAISTADAKKNASEKAFRDLVLGKLRQNTIRPSSLNAVERMDTRTSETNENEAGEQAEADEVPMINLASFAIYKLFNTWKDEGFEIPEMHATEQAANDDTQQSVKGKELPADWYTYHPSTLICIMHPGIDFLDLGFEGEFPNAIQLIGLEIDGTKYVGRAPNKKAARRNAAVKALNEKYGTNFEIEEPSDPAPTTVF